MNLFLETHRLTQAREDRLTCFLAVALEVNSTFRTAYEHTVLESLATQALPVQPDMLDGKLQSGSLFVDQLVSLHLLLGKEADARANEERLFRQVVPVLDALVTDGCRDTDCR